MYNYKIIIIYHGKYFSGWQINGEELTVQKHLEDALNIINGGYIKIFGSSRTDKGVHSYGQTANFFLEKLWDLNKLKNAINFYINKNNVIVKDIQLVDNNFHSRYSSLGKTYYYQIYLDSLIDPFKKDFWWIWKKPIDITKLKFACEVLKNSHNLNGFAHSYQELKNFYTLKDITYDINDEQLIIKFTGKGFFYNEIRYLVGHIMYYISNLMDQETFFLPLNQPDNNQYHKILAPAHGLFLMEVFY